MLRENTRLWRAVTALRQGEIAMNQATNQKRMRGTSCCKRD